MGETEIAFIPASVHVVCPMILRLEGELTISVVLFVLCVLLQIFAMDGYTTRKFSIVLYAWVSLIHPYREVKLKARWLFYLFSRQWCRA
jgi:hypothetical protein